MKTLYLMRHAKSSWDDAAIADFDRQLNPRGNRVAPLMGKLMRQRSLIPEKIISSPAERARQTALLAAEAAGFAGDVEFDDRIYEASPLRLLAVTGSVSDKVASLMLIGHNPGMEGFIWHLTGNHEPMPTAAMAILELGIESWAEISDACGTVVEVIRPRDEDL